MITVPNTPEGTVMREKLHNWVKTQDPDEICFSLLMDVGGELQLHPRVDQPCYGEMRVHYDDITKPCDLDDPFPYGTPVAVGWNFPGSYEYSTSQASVIDYLLSPSLSPYRNLLNLASAEDPDLELVYDRKGRLCGLVLLNTDINVDVIVHLMMFLRRVLLMPQHYVHYTLVKQGVDPRVAFIISQELGQNGVCKALPKSGQYDWPWNFDYKGWYNGTLNPYNNDIDKPESYTLYSRSAYHRDEAGNVADVWANSRLNNQDVFSRWDYQSLKDLADPANNSLNYSFIMSTIVPLVHSICKGDTT